MRMGYPWPERVLSDRFVGILLAIEVSAVAIADDSVMQLPYYRLLPSSLAIMKVNRSFG